jgi:hypothetical protein
MYPRICYRLARCSCSDNTCSSMSEQVRCINTDGWQLSTTAQYNAHTYNTSAALYKVKMRCMRIVLQDKIDLGRQSGDDYAEVVRSQPSSDCACTVAHLRLRSHSNLRSRYFRRAPRWALCSTGGVEGKSWGQGLGHDRLDSTYCDTGTPGHKHVSFIFVRSTSCFRL